ncbi:MAG TPA: SWIM zinc finger family protein [Halococcus sp.]|nr:SWIM zinc finger family protein [Halococcus sp.]
MHGRDRPASSGVFFGERTGCRDPTLAVSEVQDSMAIKATTAESSNGRRTIESGRFRRATTEPMTVAFDGPGVGSVEHGEQTYRVELDGGVCECADYQFRGERLICKHVLRACLSALFDGEQHSTALVARVARFAREYGCAHSVHGCNGPTTTSDRCGGLPCPGCIEAVRTSSVDEFMVWQRVATDGGRVVSR